MEFKASVAFLGVFAAFLAFLAAGAPSIPPEDARTLAQLKELGDDWEIICYDDWRGEHDPEYGDPDGIQKALDERDALRAMLVMDTHTKVASPPFFGHVFCKWGYVVL